MSDLDAWFILGIVLGGGALLGIMMIIIPRLAIIVGIIGGVLVLLMEYVIAPLAILSLLWQHQWHIAFVVAGIFAGCELLFMCCDKLHRHLVSELGL